MQVDENVSLYVFIWDKRRLPVLTDRQPIIEVFRHNLKDQTCVVSIGHLPVLLKDESPGCRTSILRYMAHVKTKTDMNGKNHEDFDSFIISCPSSDSQTAVTPVSSGGVDYGQTRKATTSIAEDQPVASTSRCGGGGGDDGSGGRPPRRTLPQDKMNDEEYDEEDDEEQDSTWTHWTLRPTPPKRPLRRPRSPCCEVTASSSLTPKGRRSLNMLADKLSKKRKEKEYEMEFASLCKRQLEQRQRGSSVIVRQHDFQLERLTQEIHDKAELLFNRQQQELQPFQQQQSHLPNRTPPLKKRKFVPNFKLVKPASSSITDRLQPIQEPITKLQQQQSIWLQERDLFFKEQQQRRQQLQQQQQEELNAAIQVNQSHSPLLLAKQELERRCLLLKQAPQNPSTQEEREEKMKLVMLVENGRAQLEEEKAILAEAAVAMEEENAEEEMDLDE